MADGLLRRVGSQLGPVGKLTHYLWPARIDDQPARVLRANVAFRAVPAPRRRRVADATCGNAAGAHARAG
jgi:hypothetical protein